MFGNHDNLKVDVISSVTLLFSPFSYNSHYNPNVEKIGSVFEDEVHQQFVENAIQHIGLSKVSAYRSSSQTPNLVVFVTKIRSSHIFFCLTCQIGRQPDCAAIKWYDVKVRWGLRICEHLPSYGVKFWLITIEIDESFLFVRLTQPK